MCIYPVSVRLADSRAVGRLADRFSCSVETLARYVHLCGNSVSGDLAVLSGSMGPDGLMCSRGTGGGRATSFGHDYAA